MPAEKAIVFQFNSDAPTVIPSADGKRFRIRHFGCEDLCQIRRKREQSVTSGSAGMSA
jgi:hypothetical protein